MPKQRVIRREKSWLKWLMLLILGLGLLLGGIYIYFLQPDIIPGIARKFDEPVTALLVAVDEDYYGNEEHEKVRADLILWGRIAPEENTLTLLFVPRHTLVDIPDWGQDMIRFAYMAGEIPMTLDVVKNLLNQEIDYYGVMDFDSFKEIVEVLEGVELYVENAIFYEKLDLDLSPGLQMLSADEALSYARYIGENESEVDRIRRQQRLALAIYERALQTRTLTRLPQLVMTIIEKVRDLKTNVDRDTVVKVVHFLRDMEEPYPEPLILPGYEEEEFFFVDERGLEQILKGVE